MPPTLAILREDPHLIAVVKPAGVLTHGYAGGEATLEDLVRGHLRPDDPGSVYLGTVHRLDRPVSGVVIWAKTPKAARRLAAQFAGRTVAKIYWTVVERQGPVEPTWDDWLGPVDASGVARVVAENSAGARRALTRVRPLAVRSPAGTMVLALQPETGRTHQLRAQAASRGMPIVGDRVYGSTQIFPAGIALHALTLRFKHPMSQAEVVVEAPVPHSWGGFAVIPRE